MQTDILQNKDNSDWRLVNSGTDLDPVLDIIFGESSFQHKRDLLLTNTGELGASPSFGVGMFNYVDDDSDSEVIQKIRIESGKDGLTIKELLWPSFPAGEIRYYANYNS